MQNLETKTLTPSTSPKKSTQKRVSINTSSTQYELITKISKKLKWKIEDSEDDSDSDLYWVDLAIQPERFCKLKPYQKINHFPNMHELARKNCLTKNLSKMRKLFPNDFNFYPKTWLYPAELPKMKLKCKKNKIYIVKPEAASQGKGIFLTRNLDGFEENERYVVQEYVRNPLLIDGLKFDLRVYVLVAGCEPLKVFVHRDGLARFATEAYSLRDFGNLSNACMHLTNYAINKNSEKFVFNSSSEKDNIGHKQSLKATLNKLDQLGFNSSEIWSDIKSIIIKSLSSVQPSLSHVYKACHPDDPYNNMCFEILGFDILLDETGKSWLLEVNHAPSFNIDSPLDLKIKENVITDTLSLLNISSSYKKEYEERKKRQILLRTLGRNKEQEKQNKLNDILGAQNKRNLWESEHLAGFEMIYPNTQFDKYIQASHKIWVESTGGKLPQSDPRPQTQHAIHTNPKKVSVIRKVDPGVFQRLYQTKKPKIEPQRVSPCYQLDDSFKDTYFKTDSPTKLLKFSVPLPGHEKSRYRSTPKKRVSYNQQLEEYFKDHSSFSKFKKSLFVDENPLKIFSMVTDDKVFKDSQKAKFFREKILRKLF